jgi:hypothetical protein
MLRSLSGSATLSAIAAILAFAPSARADGREPASLLVYPIHEARQQIFKDEDSPIPVGGQLIAPPAFTLISVTNTNRNGSGTTDVHFEYVNVSPSADPFFFADCSIADRVETLTPADTLTVITDCHNSEPFAQGYLVVTALDPDLVDTPWSFNHLIGSEQIVSIGGGIYGLEAIPFKAIGPQGSATDLDSDGRRDFDGSEYERLPDELYLDSFVGIIAGEIVLVAFTGPEYLVNVDFIIYNDDEFQLSGQYAFSCWSRVLLAQISGFFTDQGLSTTSNDSRALDIDCDNDDDFETGWAILRARDAISPTSPTIDDPALLGATTFPFGQFMNGRLLWESVARQTTASFPQ